MDKKKIKSVSINQPQLTNSGAGHTQNDEKNEKKEGLRALVDWVSLVVPSTTFLKTISDVLKLPIDYFDTPCFGNKKYPKGIQYGHIKVCWNPDDETYESEYNVYVDMSGQGCREFEEYSNIPWHELFKDILDKGGHFTRIDVAIDDFEGYFTPKKLLSKWDKGEVVSPFTKAGKREDKKQGGESLGMTVYFGSDQSEVQIRVYDKQKERINDGKEVTVDFWVRTEIESRRKKAMKIAEHIVGKCSAMDSDNESETLGYVVKGILSHHLRFIDRKTSNKSRDPVSKFWERFLGDVEKLELSTKAPDKTIDSTMEWLKNSVSKSLALVVEANGGDLRILAELVEHGRYKLKESEREMARNHFLLNELKKQEE